MTQLETEWLDWPVRYDHLSWSKIDRLVIAGIIPKTFNALKGKTYLCPSCSFGVMIHRAWRTKGNPGNIGKNAKTPGDLVSDGQLMSSHPGIIPRISGRHTRDQISCATCFYDTFPVIPTSIYNEVLLVNRHFLQKRILNVMHIRMGIFPFSVSFPISFAPQDA